MEFNFKDTHKICWLQIIDALPETWNDITLKGKENTKSLVTFDHHIVRNSQIHSLNKLTSKELYLILVEANTVLNNILYHNKILFKFGKVTSPRCFFCKLHKTSKHLFV